MQLKPWPNRLASRRKLKTWAHLQLRLVRPCVNLRWLAMTCAHFGRIQVFHRFIWPPNPSQRKLSDSILFYSNLCLLANQIQDTAVFFVFVFVFFLFCSFFWRLARTGCPCEETCEFLWPPNSSLYASSACGYLRVRQFGQGFIVKETYLFHRSLFFSFFPFFLFSFRFLSFPFLSSPNLCFAFHYVLPFW